MPIVPTVRDVAKACFERCRQLLSKDPLERADGLEKTAIRILAEVVEQRRQACACKAYRPLYAAEMEGRADDLEAKAGALIEQARELRQKAKRNRCSSPK